MSSIPRPHSPYFLVRVSKQKEKESKQKVGSIIIPDNLTFMQFNTQVGEVVGIGEAAGKYFPEAEVGHWLLMHHFVQGMDANDARTNHLIHEDEDYNYYVVTVYACNGKDAEGYGVWDGEKIIPNKDYVFLFPEKPPVNDLPPDEAINQALKKSESGLFLFSKWRETREDKEAKQAELKKQVEELSKSGTNKIHIQQAIAGKQLEMDAISKDINVQTYAPYAVAFANPQLSEWFGRPITSGEVLGLLNIACGTGLTVNGVDYIVAKTKFIAYLYDKNQAA